MPIKIPEKRNVIKTIKINNGTLTAELDDDHNVYWFRNGKYITPNQMKNYKFYDPAIKGYKQLSDVVSIFYDGDKRTFGANTKVYTPNLDTIYSRQREIHSSKDKTDSRQRIPFSGKKITLRTKGKMNLADVPVALLDSIAVNSGRSNTDFFTNSALIGKESTFGGYSEALGYPMSGELTPHVLTNNHAYFENAYKDYSAAISRKRTKGGFIITPDDSEIVKDENNAKYALEHNLITDKTPHYSEYVLADAFKRFESNPAKYNSGQGNYVPMVNAIRQELIGEKQLQEYWNTRGKQEYERGKKEGMKLGGRIHLDEIRTPYKDGGIYIKPSKRGTFTAAATKHCMGVQEFASKVLRNKEDYSPSLVKKANFARNASKWH